MVFLLTFIFLLQGRIVVNFLKILYKRIRNFSRVSNQSRTFFVNNYNLKLHHGGTFYGTCTIDLFSKPGASW